MIGRRKGKLAAKHEYLAFPAYFRGEAVSGCAGDIQRTEGLAPPAPPPTLFRLPAVWVAFSGRSSGARLANDACLPGAVHAGRSPKDGGACAPRTPAYALPPTGGTGGVLGPLQRRAHSQRRVLTWRGSRRKISKGRRGKPPGPPFYYRGMAQLVGSSSLRATGKMCNVPSTLHIERASASAPRKR